MMKLATILPTKYLGEIAGRPMHMALAHLIEADKEYTEFYKKEAEAGAYVILDNGVVETGVPVSIDELIRKAQLIGASELIIPDHFLQGAATIESAIECIPYVRREAPEIKIMVVPQGESLEEWLYYAREIIQLDIDTIGIPKVLTKLAGRDARIHALQELGYATRGLDIHLLGCWENPIELTAVAKAVSEGKIPTVRSCDSAIVYVYARDNMVISQGPRPSGAIDFAAMDANLETLRKNIKIWEKSVLLEKNNVHEIL